MPYGTVKVDNVTFTNNSVDATTTFSGIYASITDNLTLSGTATATTFTGTTANFTNVNAQNIGVTTSLSGLAITGGTAGFTTITGTTVTGTTANFVTVSGTTVTGTTARFITITGGTAGFTTITGTTVTGTTANFVTVSGTTVTGTTASFTSGIFTSLSGTTHTITSGVFASGTAALPSISFVSDPNTGIYSPGADQVAVATSGTGRLFVAADGKVGIGTATPGALLNLSHVTASDARFSVNTVLVGSIYASASDFNVHAVANVPLTFNTNNTERLRITAAGLVGIGTSSPVAALDVNGRIAAVAGTAGSPSYHCNTDTNTGINLPEGDRIQFVTGGVEAVRIDSSQRVGIGTTSPTQLLDVVANTDGSAGQRIRNDSIGASAQSVLTISAAGREVTYVVSYSGQFASETGSSITSKFTNFDTHVWRSNAGTERARIDSSGRLLVGTSTARGVSTSSTQNNRIQITDVGGSIGGLSTYYYSADGGANTWNFCKSRGSSDGSFTIVNSGDGLGTINWIGADGNGFTSIAASISAAVDGTPGSNDMPGRLVFSTTADGAASPTERMRITSAGNVGIGTASPGQNLVVAGTGTITIRITSGVGSGDISHTGTDFYITNNSAGSIPFWINGSERARIDTLGRLLVGTSSILSNIGSIKQEIAGGNFVISSFQATAFAFAANFVKSRSTSTLGTILSSGDQLGPILWYGDDGTATAKAAASIDAFVDGTPGASDMPGRLVFSTTADGASSSTERLRITSAGVLQIADAGNITVGTTTGTKIGTATTQKLGFYNATPVVQPTAVADATTAVDVITQLNALLAKLRTLGIIAT